MTFILFVSILKSEKIKVLPTGMDERKITFRELMPTPKAERDRSVKRRKTMTTYLLTSPENQKIIENADKVTKKREETKAKREIRFKEVIKEDRKVEAAKKRAEKAKKKPVRSTKSVRGRPKGGPRL